MSRFQWPQDKIGSAEEVRAQAKRAARNRAAAFRPRPVEVVTAPVSEPEQSPILLPAPIFGMWHIPVSSIVRVVCNYFHLPPGEMKSASRMAPSVRQARRIGMFLAHTLTNSSQEQIALTFGMGGHNATHKAVEIVTHQLLAADEEMMTAVGSITIYLQSLYPNATEIPERPPAGRPRKGEEAA